MTTKVNTASHAQSQVINDLLNSTLNLEHYKTLYQLSIDAPELFWDVCAKHYLSWFKEYSLVYTGNINHFKQINNQLNNQWFVNGQLNACYNCLDRHLPKHADKIAYYWQGDELAIQSSVTYQELYLRVCKFSNILLSLGVTKGDKVCIYLPVSLEGITAMLACARIGAVHTVVFAGFSAAALADRIVDAECKLLISTDRVRRGGKDINLWNYVTNTANIVYQQGSKVLNKILYINNYYSDSNFKIELKLFQNIQIQIANYSDLVNSVDNHSAPVWMDSEDPLFILYTSGSTGKPKGVLHTTAGYLLHTILSFNKLLDIDNKQYTDDVYWSTGDIGWVAGHSYVVYGALGNAMTSVIFSGTPNYPNHDMYWQIIDKYKVTIFYTAPTAIRALMKEGDAYLSTTSRSSLRLLATVGEPINYDAWQWYYHAVGKDNCPVLDSWWQTETGAVMLSPLPVVDILKPGCAMLPFFGIQLAVLDEDNQEIKSVGQGNLVVKAPWPGMTRTVYKNHSKFIETYFAPYQDYFYTGDIAKIDEDGHYWVLGRSDDVLNISGHRFGTAEIESALLGHVAVAEVAVVPVPDSVKGQVLFAFVVLENHAEFTPNLIQELIKHVKLLIGSIVVFKDIKIVNNLPKTRSGKIMRRILKKIAVGDTENLGDLSTLLDQDVIADLINLLNSSNLMIDKI